jgi:hypothetical protein
MGRIERDNKRRLKFGAFALKYSKHVPQYHENDVDFQLTTLGEQHRQAVERQRIRHIINGGKPTDLLPQPWDLLAVSHRLVRQVQRRLFGTSKYQPHQGAKECARRVRQGV